MSESAGCPSPIQSVDGIVGALTHSQVYHVQCGRCGATSVRDVNYDTVRMICPSCERRLTLPATISATCAFCHLDWEYTHTLAGHSTACASCGRPVTLGPVVGRAESHHPSGHHHHEHHYHEGRRAPKAPKRTIAFSEGAERSLVLIVAALATLIFIVVASLH